MTSDRLQLKNLQTVTAAQLAGAQVAFQKYRNQELALRETLSQLKVDRSQQAMRDGEPDAARAAGADVLWLQWVEKRRATINSELALIISRKIEAHRKLKKAFGKDQVVKALIAQHKRPA